MARAFQPACRPFAPGGLPHQHAAQAVRIQRTVLPESLTVPYLPRQQFREQLMTQSALGFPGLTIDSELQRVYVERAATERDMDTLGLAYLQNQTGTVALPSEGASGLYEVLRLGNQRPLPGALMVSVAGPISLGLHLTDEQQRPLAHDPALRDALAQHLALRVGWLANKLTGLAEQVVIWLEEPFLSAVGSPFCPVDWHDTLELLELVLCGVPGQVFGGIVVGSLPTHDTNPPPEAEWTTLLRSSAALLAFDVVTHGAALRAASTRLRAFLEQGGMLAWRLVPAEPNPPAPAALAAHLDALLDAVETTSLHRHALLRASWISTTGTLEQLSVTDAEAVLRCCHATATYIRQHAGLPLNETGQARPSGDHAQTVAQTRPKE